MSQHTILNGALCYRHALAYKSYSPDVRGTCLFACTDLRTDHIVIILMSFSFQIKPRLILRYLSKRSQHDFFFLHMVCAAVIRLMNIQIRGMNRRPFCRPKLRTNIRASRTHANDTKQNVSKKMWPFTLPDRSFLITMATADS